MTVSLRPVDRGDAAELAAVTVGAWQAAYRGLVEDAYLDALNVEDSTRRWAGFLAGGELPAITVAERDSTLVGFCGVATPSTDDDADPECAEIQVLNVRPDAWRTGVGTALLTDALARFWRDGWRNASLWVVEGNERAELFYRRFGFTFDGATGVHERSGAPLRRMKLKLGLRQ